MSRGVGVAAVALALGLGVLPAAADGDGAVVRTTRLVFTGAEASVRAASAWVGQDHARDGLDSSGLRLRLIAGGGAFRTDGGDGRRRWVDKAFASAAAGYAMVGPRWRFAAFLGPELEAQRGRAPAGGLRLSAEMWGEVTAATRLSLSASHGTAVGSFDVRLLIAHAIHGNPVGAGLFAGPEVACVGNRDGLELRAGAALLGLSIGGLELRLAGGGAWKDDGDSGGYATVSGWTRF